MTIAQMDPAVALADLQVSKPDKVTIVLLSGDMDKAMAAFSSTIVTFSGLEACRSANVIAGSICAIVMTLSFLSGPHEFGDFNGVLTIVSASFSCQGNDLDLT